MRNGLLAALTSLLAFHGSALAQHDGSDSDTVLSRCDGEAPVKTCGFRGSAEYLLWWFKSGRIPPLATAGGDGILGSPGTRVLVDDLDFDDDVRHGGRFALGYRFGSCPCLGVEAGYFFLWERQSDVRFSSAGDPLLAQPFLNVVTGRPDANLVAKLGTTTGTVTVGAETRLWGADANLTADLIRGDAVHLTALGGFRFVSLEDEVTSGERFRVSPDVPGFGGSRVRLQDDFRTVNNFYGGQTGLEAGVRFGALTIDVRGKIALGQMQQVAHVNGVTDVLSRDGSRTLFQGGLYALRSNIGRHQRDELAVIPEAGLNIGLEVTRRLKLTAGYSFLWINTVALAGEQIDPVINVSQFPIRSGDKPLVGPARPAFPFDGTDFWAQGLNFGLELRF